MRSAAETCENQKDKSRNRGVHTGTVPVQYRSVRARASVSRFGSEGGCAIRVSVLFFPAPPPVVFEPNPVPERFKDTGASRDAHEKTGHRKQYSTVQCTVVWKSLWRHTVFPFTERPLSCHKTKFPTCPRRAPYLGACTTAKSSTRGVRAMRACESLQPPTHQRSNSTSRDWCSLATASRRAGVEHRIARRCHALVACRACSTVLWRSIGHLRCHLPSQRIARSISCGACKQANSHQL